MGVWRGFTISVEENLIVPNDDENHTGCARLKKKVCTERVNGLEARKRCRGLRESGHEAQREQEDKQGAREGSVVHYWFSS
jgi:hypothetical protein